MPNTSHSKSNDLPILDTRRLENILDNDEEMLIEFIAEFNQLLLDDLEAISKELEREYDFDTIRSHAHKIKGSSNNFGAEFLADISSEIEEASRKKNATRIKELESPFSQAAAATLDAIKLRLNS
ncbi:Hpt domain-containing protein [Puniceicoccaceae bacterium K14]|nr:Hpt domain-containing protein [Puniceicoccaceae bacterium K14]